MLRYIFIYAALSAVLAGCDNKAAVLDTGPVGDWPVIGHDARGQRFSPITQITPDNVKDLEVAWVYHHGDFTEGGSDHGASAFQATPLVIDETLFFCTPFSRVIALDPETGEERWVFDPKVDISGVYTPTCRGVAHWRETDRAGGEGECSRRIFTGTLDARLIALDAQTGQRCADFGDNGEINLLHCLGDIRQAEYYITSAPLVIGNLVLTTAFARDGERVDSPPGALRAFDARSGELVWTWDPVPPGLTAKTANAIKAGQTLTRGTPGTWGTLSADTETGIIYVPVGNPEPNHYAGKERGDMDYYGSSIVALDAATGKPLWHFQTVHHDIWDYDVAAQPVLYRHRGNTPAVIGATKMGLVFLLNAKDGKPLFPVEEKPVPQTDVPGEHTAPTQPFPSMPPPLHPLNLKQDDVWGLTFWDRSECREQFEKLRYEGVYTPPSQEGTLAYPGLGGGINWGSVSVDPHHRRMVLNLQMLPFTVKLVARSSISKEDLQPGGDLVGQQLQEGTPYIAVRGPFISSWGTPCIPPPWGKLVAIDLDSGEILWQRPLGNLNKQAPFGRFFEWGTPNTGGSIQTASGLIFIGATMDHYFRAFDTWNGREVWHYELPFAAHATPATYRLRPDGKQYVVIAAGGHGAFGTKAGDALFAFALPD